MLEDVNDEIPLFTEREQETVLEGEPIGTKVTQVNAIDKDGTFPNNQVRIRLYRSSWSGVRRTTSLTIWLRPPRFPHFEFRIARIAQQMFGKMQKFAANCWNGTGKASQVPSELKFAVFHWYGKQLALQAR